jgi:hypothetical protein
VYARTWLDVLFDDVYVCIPIRSTVLMKESQGVHQLMCNDAFCETFIHLQRHRLIAAGATDKR